VPAAQPSPRLAQYVEIADGVAALRLALPFFFA